MESGLLLCERQGTVVPSKQANKPTQEGTGDKVVTAGKKGLSNQGVGEAREGQRCRATIGGKKKCELYSNLSSEGKKKKKEHGMKRPDWGEVRPRLGVGGGGGVDGERKRN